MFRVPLARHGQLQQDADEPDERRQEVYEAAEHGTSPPFREGSARHEATVSHASFYQQERLPHRTLVAEYGADNVVGAWVHVDEPGARPHMHFDFVPVTEDGRLSAKDLMTRAHLRRMHPKVQEAAERDLGHPVHVLLPEQEREARAGRYVGLPEYKAATREAAGAAEKARAAREDARSAQKEAVRASERAREAREGAREAQRAIGDARADLGRLRASRERVRSELDTLTADADKERSQAAALDRELERKTARRDALESDLATLERKTAEAKRVADAAKADMDELNAEYDQAQQAHKARMEGLQRGEEAAREEIEQLKSQIRDAEGRAGEAVERRADPLAADVRRLGVLAQGPHAPGFEEARAGVPDSDSSRARAERARRGAAQLRARVEEVARRIAALLSSRRRAAFEPSAAADRDALSAADVRRAARSARRAGGNGRGRAWGGRRLG